ncbi:hypothetical protein [Micromonospora noduli]|uniref:DUF3592 domain-containing protein n=1 Tax=Micromonospora noduli TaxID=709876 RepID=A0ABX9CXX4_9ACTN|nr:hypothetical protein [Micromonospora noduli]RAO09246.1 hypothetical protein GUI43_03845 [Micromonospora noduli]RAO14307.1 hypothetical protein MED15_04659 [Micromonospora noduli]RAO29005.1 hypothetical protein ONO23_04769 [Micromonospora noduli]
MHAVKMRWAAIVVVGLALVGMLSWVAGSWPADQARATVDHCYVTHDRLEAMHSRCVGNWTRGGRGRQGPIHGLDVQKSWKVIDDEPNSAYEWEVAVPASARQPRVLADTRQAWTLSPRALPWGLGPAGLVALLAAFAWLITATVRAPRPPHGVPAEPSVAPA